MAVHSCVNKARKDSKNKIRVCLSPKEEHYELVGNEDGEISQTLKCKPVSEHLNTASYLSSNPQNPRTIHALQLMVVTSNVLLWGGGR